MICLSTTMRIPLLVNWYYLQYCIYSQFFFRGGLISFRFCRIIFIFITFAIVSSPFIRFVFDIIFVFSMLFRTFIATFYLFIFMSFISWFLSLSFTLYSLSFDLNSASDIWLPFFYIDWCSLFDLWFTSSLSGSSSSSSSLLTNKSLLMKNVDYTKLPLGHWILRNVNEMILTFREAPP